VSLGPTSFFYLPSVPINNQVCWWHICLKLRPLDSIEIRKCTQWTMELWNSLIVGLRAGYLSVCTAGGASDRHWQKALLTNGLTYLLLVFIYIYSYATYLWHWNFLASCSPCWTDCRQDKASVLLICTNGKLHRQKSARMVSYRRQTTLSSRVHWTTLPMVSFYDYILPMIMWPPGYEACWWKHLI